MNSENMLRVMINREDVFKILGLFDFELQTAGSLSCVGWMKENQIEMLKENNFGFTVLKSFF